MTGALVVGREGQDHVEQHRDGISLVLLQPGRPVSINEVAGRSRLAWKGAPDAWKAKAETLARDAVRALPHLIQRYMETGAAYPAVTVQLRWQAPGKRRRDPHNYTSTMVKAVVDGLVRAHIVLDDTAEYVHVLDPEIIEVPAKTDARDLWAWVDIFERPAGRVRPVGSLGGQPVHAYDQPF